MKTILKAAAFMALAGVVACNKTANPAEEVKPTDKALFKVDVNPPTKVTFSGEDLVWEGDESIGILLGNESSTSTDASSRSTQKLASVEGTTGIFEGVVTLDNFTADDIKGIVYPFDENHYYRRNGTSNRIVMTVATTPQLQKSNNVLNGKNTPMFCSLTKDDLMLKNGAYIVEGKQLSWGCALVRFNVYGVNSMMEADEYLVSVTLHSASKTAIAGTSEWDYGTGEFKFNGKAVDPVVQLEEQVTIKDKTSENGVKVYMALLNRGTLSLSEGSYVTVSTNKSEYTMNINTTIELNAGEVRKIGLDLSKFSCAEPNALPATTWIDEEVW